MEDINVRIKELIDKKFNGNNSKFARKLNISEGNVRGYINNTEPKFSFFSRLFSELPEISYEWLLLGKGDMLYLPEILKSRQLCLMSRRQVSNLPLAYPVINPLCLSLMSRKGTILHHQLSRC